MISSEKIAEWIKEVQERPTSAPLIIQYIANRLRHLAERNEELLAENIALQSGKRVAEYERRIAHLEYQLDLLKRSSLEAAALEHPPETTPEQDQISLLGTASLLIYSPGGKILRLPLNTNALQDSQTLGKINWPSESSPDGLRMLAVSSNDDLLFVFTSGRLYTTSVVGIPPALSSGEIFEWEKLPMPDEPRAGEALACLVPLSKMALSAYFIQVSRKGFTKKINLSMAESILANRYIGTGIKQTADETFEVILCREADHLLMVSAQGYTFYTSIAALPYTIEAAMRLETADHLTSVLVPQPDESLLAATQIGMLIHRPIENLEPATTLKTKGQPLYSSRRREQGTKVVSAGMVTAGDWAITLHQDGALRAYAVNGLFDSGKIPLETNLIGMAYVKPRSPAAPEFTGEWPT